jgi:hypothetical protein
MNDTFYASTEIRWFWPGWAGWLALLDWFEGNGRLPTPIHPEPARTDHYLCLPDCQTVGVKQREGRFEVKALTTAPHPATVETAVGQIDEWVKWSLQPSAAIALPFVADLDQSGPWRAVSKQRYTRLYQVDGEWVTAVAPGTIIAAGCSVELTQITVAAATEKWLTLGFEAFGSVEKTAVLEKVLSHFLRQQAPPPANLTAANSLSYPAWLLGLRQ